MSSCKSHHGIQSSFSICHTAGVHVQYVHQPAQILLFILLLGCVTFFFSFRVYASLLCLNTSILLSHLIRASILQGRGIPRMQALTPFIEFPATRAFLSSSRSRASSMSNLTLCWKVFITLTSSALTLQLGPKPEP